MISYYDQAKTLHKMSPVVDSHLDLAGEILLRHQNGEKDIIKRYYLNHWQIAGIRFIISSIYVPTCQLSEGWDNVLAQIGCIKQELAFLSSQLILVTSKQDIDYVLSHQMIGIILYMEGLDCIGHDIPRLETLWNLGIRGASLTWSRTNELATGCCTATKHQQITGAITHFGLSALHKMKELGMFLDISHLNDQGFEQLLLLTDRPMPIIATHSNARSVFDNYRNLTDSQILNIAQEGGMLGLNAYKYIVGTDSADDAFDAMCQHI